MSAYIKPGSVRKLVKECGKRVGRSFIAELDARVAEKIEAACRVHNGGRKTLDRDVVLMVFGKIR